MRNLLYFVMCCPLVEVLAPVNNVLTTTHDSSTGDRPARQRGCGRLDAADDQQLATQQLGRRVEPLAGGVPWAHRLVLGRARDRDNRALPPRVPRRAHGVRHDEGDKEAQQRGGGKTAGGSRRGQGGMSLQYLC